jgi:ribonuclease HI
MQIYGISDWDAVIFTDGSGNSWDRGGGWAAVITCRNDGSRRVLHGGMSNSTVGISELSAVLYSLVWYEAKGRPSGGLKPKVHIFSDSQHTVVDVGAGRSQPGHATSIMWGAIRQAGIRLQLHWHWLPRDKTALNQICDWIAGESRKAIADMKIIEKLTEDVLYGCNPIRGTSA